MRYYKKSFLDELNDKCFQRKLCRKLTPFVIQILLTAAIFFYTVQSRSLLRISKVDICLWPGDLHRFYSKILFNILLRVTRNAPFLCVLTFFMDIGFIPQLQSYANCNSSPAFRSNNNCMSMNSNN